MSQARSWLDVSRWDETHVAVGRLRGCGVRIERTGEAGAWQWAIEASDAALPPDLELRTEGRLDGLRRFIGQDLQIGDPDFDGLVLVRGPEAPLRAALSEAVRWRVLDWLAVGVEIRAPRVRWAGPGPASPTARMLARVRGLVALVRSLVVPPEELALRIRNNALRDPAPGVRARNLRLLVDLERDRLDDLLSDLDEPALLTLLDHDDLAVRLEAIAALGEHGTSRAIAPLVAVADGLFVNGTLKTAAGAARGRIIDRLGGLTEGGLALVEGGGELTLVKP